MVAKVANNDNTTTSDYESGARLVRKKSSELKRKAHKRFSKLLHTRIGKAQGMRSWLGVVEWGRFVCEALRVGKPMFVGAFTESNMFCRGPLGSNQPCTNPCIDDPSIIDVDHRCVCARTCAPPMGSNAPVRGALCLAPAWLAFC